MARTDNTLPYRLWSDYDVRSDLRRWKSRHKSVVRDLRREHNRRDRHDARDQIRCGADVEPRQTRGRALWDVL